jgi:PDZ domain-containing secreted protein
MKHFLLQAAFILLIVDSSFAQNQTQTLTFDATNSIMLREFGVVAVEKEQEIIVEVQLGTSFGASSTSAETLEKGDLLIMMNGQRFGSIDELKNLYEEAEPESELKIGVRRGSERFIVRALKGAMPESSGRKIMMSVDGSVNGNAITAVPELGVLISSDATGVTIEAGLPPLLREELKGTKLEGAKILSVNGKAFKTTEELVSYLAALSRGSEIELIISGANGKETFQIEKTAGKGNFQLNID